MTPRQQRAQRKQWRKNFKAHYLRKKLAIRTAQMMTESTPPDSPELSESENIHQARYLRPRPIGNEESTSSNNPLRYHNASQNQSPVPIGTSATTTIMSSKLRQLRYKKDKEIRLLKQKIIILKRLNDRYRKQLERAKKSPMLITNTKLHRIESIPQLPLLIKKKKINSVSITVRKDLELFFEEDDNSRLCAGKKEFITRHKVRKQKRYLTDTLANLHSKYLKTGKYKLSYATFCRMRPFWVLIPDTRSRETCSCKLHTNIELLIQALRNKKIIAANNSQDLLSYLCCDTMNVECLNRSCSNCKSKVVPYLEFDNSREISYWQWVTKLRNVRHAEKSIRVTVKVKLFKTPLDIIKDFESILNDFFIHCGTIVGQYKAIKYLKTNLLHGECIVHLDFSENYSVKCHEEVQSYHFGSSRIQITLHTSVIYFLDEDGILKHQSFCTVSDCCRHDVSAVWAHIIPILEYIVKICPFLHSIHFLSDSPSSQYRNKKIFHVIESLHRYANTISTVTWNFSESGHGKGAPDGVGATLKRTADQVVSRGRDISNVNDFLEVVAQHVKNVEIRTVSEYDIYEKDLLFPQEIASFAGCMKIHQIVWSLNSTSVAVRKLSCFDDLCKASVICPHSNNHLGFYNLPKTSSSSVQDIYVKPLAESTREIELLQGAKWLEGQETLSKSRPEIIANKPVILSNILIKPANHVLKNKNVYSDMQIKKEIASISKENRATTSTTTSRDLIRFIEDENIIQQYDSDSDTDLNIF